MQSIVKSLQHRGVSFFKNLYYMNRGESIQYGNHYLKYVPGTRPVRLKYIDSNVGTVRNDAKQIKYFLDNVKSGDFVLDIGGNVGQYAVFFASLVSASGKVITFEPNKAAIETIKRNLLLNGFGDRVEIEELAIFDTNGTHMFFTKGNADANAALIEVNVEDTSLGNSTQSIVKTSRLDDYLQQRNLRTPDWIKLDTEGAEINILKGSKHVLSSEAIIVCELHPYAWPQFGTCFEELLDIVNEAGRTITYLDQSLKIEDGAFYGATIIS
jgi:FkbM family methyltransferase